MVGRGKKVRKGNSKSNVERNMITEVTSKLLNLEAIVSVLTYNHPFKSRLSLIVRVNVVLNRSVVVDSD